MSKPPTVIITASVEFTTITASVIGDRPRPRAPSTAMASYFSGLPGRLGDQEPGEWRSGALYLGEPDALFRLRCRRQFVQHNPLVVRCTGDGGEDFGVDVARPSEVALDAGGSARRIVFPAPYQPCSAFRSSAVLSSLSP
jgi:hypothetical protein